MGEFVFALMSVADVHSVCGNGCALKWPWQKCEHIRHTIVFSPSLALLSRTPAAPPVPSARDFRCLRFLTHRLDPLPSVVLMGGGSAGGVGGWMRLERVIALMCRRW